MRFFLLFAALTTLPLAHGQTVDKPATPEDLSSQLSDEKTRFDDQMQFLERVKKALRSSADASADRIKQAAVVHAEVVGCLTTGDHRRALSRLYGRAAAEAGRIAAEWEARAKAPVAAAGSDSQREFTRQIEEAEQRIEELRRKTEATPEDRDEISGLSARVSQLRGVLGLFDEVVRQADPSRYGKAAAEMRQKELLMQHQAEGAELEAGAANLECRAGLLAIRSLKEQEDIDNQLRVWRSLPSEQRGTDSRPVR